MKKIDYVKDAIDTYLNHYNRISYSDMKEFFGYSQKTESDPIADRWRKVYKLRKMQMPKGKVVEVE